MVIKHKPITGMTFRFIKPVLVVTIVLVSFWGASISYAKEKEKLSVWFMAGVGKALKVMELNVKDFHQVQSGIEVEMTLVPEGVYNERILSAGKTGDLPCLLFFDGPLVAYFAWLGYLQPIDRFVSAEMKKDFLPSVISQGTYGGKLFTLGIYDSGLALYGNRHYLNKANVRIPTVDRPWTLVEFEDALKRLTVLKEVAYALDMKINYGRGEFYTYAFSPILQSFGGDLIDRNTFKSATGVLDGQQSTAAMKRFQSWFKKGWANRTPHGDDDFYGSKKAALSWSGHWMYPKHSAGLGKDLIVLPMPDFGNGPKTGMGTWNWGICSTCQEPEQAWAFLEFMLQPKNVLRWSNVHGGVPARKSVLAQSRLYKNNGPLYTYVQQINAGWTVPRPPTPAYSSITKAFSGAVENIIQGADVQIELTKAAQKIDNDIQAYFEQPQK